MSARTSWVGGVLSGDRSAFTGSFAILALTIPVAAILGACFYVCYMILQSSAHQADAAQFEAEQRIAKAAVLFTTAPVINQGLVRFLGPDGNHDRFTDQVIHRIQADGVAWVGGVTWCGQRAMRISVCNWLTADDDIDRTIASVRRSLAR